MSNKNVERDQDVSLKLFIVLSRAFEAIEKQIVKNVKEYGLNLTEFAVLELLFHKGDQPIQKVGQKILLASSSITYVIDKLENKNYLTRKACPTDRRVIYASITDEGKKLMEDIFPKHKEAMSKIMGGLTTHEKELVTEKLKILGLYAQQL
ncbi:MarR family winged helix-turn-helix transcriptional regulator [Caldifermentibacillus hisashii]|jgi:MarR family transcriptional regulator, 2-MHQ and catechol-resistance regulon repressor|uniref:MarR family winged helix-turn-helix transcriptional regulator n=1 Tax=Caldifermentibacillus hisashii TaxID=996558 RepID=UPI003D23F48E